MSWLPVRLTIDVNDRGKRELSPMNIDATSAVTDVYALPGQISGAEDADWSVVAEMPLTDFQLIVQQLNDAAAEAMAAVAGQVTSDQLPESYDDGEQTSLAVYLSGEELVSPHPIDVELPKVNLSPTTFEQWQPGTVVTEFTAIDHDAVQTSTEQRSTEPLSSGIKSAVPKTAPAARTAPSMPVELPEQQTFPSVQPSEPSTVAAVTASADRPLVTDLRPGVLSSPSLPVVPASALSLQDVMIAGGQHHARAVAHLPHLGTVQVEMTRASASEVTVRLHAHELTVAALDNCSPALHHLVASTLLPVTATEATVREAGHGSGAEPGIKIALSLTSHNQSQTDSGEYQQPTMVGTESSQPGAEQLTMPARVLPMPATALVDLLI